MNAANINLDNLNLKTRIGGLIFDILLDKRFFVPDMDSVVHKHKHSLYEFHYIAKGEGTLYVNEKEYTVYAGNYFIINSGIYHKQTQNNDNPIHKYCFKFEYSCQHHLIDSFFPEEESVKIFNIFNNIDFFVNDKCNKNNSHKIIYIIDEIKEELSYQKVGYYARLQCLFTQLFVFIVRDITSDKRTDYSIPQKLPYEKHSAMIEGFFDKHFNDKVTSDDLCKLLNLSTSQLNRILKKKYHSTFGQKLLEMRIEAAKKYLETTDMQISTIAFEVGYSTSSHFCSIFKENCGITPSEYRLAASNKST